MLQRRVLEGYKLASVRSRGVLMVGCVATEGGEVAGTKTPGKGRIISFTHNALKMKNLLAIIFSGTDLPLFLRIGRRFCQRCYWT